MRRASALWCAVGLVAASAANTGANSPYDVRPFADGAVAVGAGADLEAGAAVLPRFDFEVVVTAQKREERVRDVPIALAVLPDYRLEEAGIETAEHALALVPNMFLADSFTVGTSFVTARGVTQINNGDPPLAVVVDGVYQGNQKQLNQELFDIERIEILKGPQGALYGRNSIGGALSIITMQPTDTFSGMLRGGLANGSGFGLSTALSGKVSELDLGIRLAASHKRSDGLIENSFLRTKADPYEDTTGRLRLDWQPSDQLGIDLRVSSSDTQGGAVMYSLFPTTGSANDFSFDPDASVLGRSDRQLHDFTLQGTWQNDAVSVTSITGFSRVTEEYFGDADISNPERAIAFPLGQLAQGQELTAKMFSQEARLASRGDSALQWLGGVYLLDTDRRLSSKLYLDLAGGTAAGFIPILQLAEDNDNRAWAVFGQIDHRLADAWRASLSLRYDEDERQQLDLVSGGRRTVTFDAVQPRLAVSYLPSADSTIYASVGTGFRSGGYNAPSVTPDIFNDETSLNFEVGFKATLGPRLELDGAAYLTELDDAQFFRVDVATASQIIDNILEVRHRGFELGLRLTPATGLELYGGIGVNDSRIEDFDGTDRFVGNQSPNNIRGKINAGAQYSRLVSSTVVVIARGDLEWRGSQYWSADNLDVQDPLALLNLRLSAKWRDWAVASWARNVTDERYYVEYADAAWAGIISGDDVGQLGRPRSYGVDFTRRF